MNNNSDSALFISEAALIAMQNKKQENKEMNREKTLESQNKQPNQKAQIKKEKNV